MNTQQFISSLRIQCDLFEEGKKTVCWWLDEEMDGIEIRSEVWGDENSFLSLPHFVLNYLINFNFREILLHITICSGHHWKNIFLFSKTLMRTMSTFWTCSSKISIKTRRSATPTTSTTIKKLGPWKIFFVLVLRWSLFQANLPEAGIEPRTFLLWGNMTGLTTAPPCRPFAILGSIYWIIPNIYTTYRKIHVHYCSFFLFLIPGRTHCKSWLFGY